MEENDDIHPSIRRLRTDLEPEISFERRDELIKFNTDAFWWCYYDAEANVLYDQFCNRINVDAKKYLMSIGLIDENNNILKVSDFSE